MRVTSLRIACCIAFSSLLFTASASSETLSDALAKCSNEKNSLKRLVCFDTIVKNMNQFDQTEIEVTRALPQTAPVTVTALPSPSVPTQTAPVQAERAQPVPTLTTSPAAPQSEVKAADAEQDTMESFGRKKVKEDDTKAFMKDGEMFAVVVEAKQMGNKKMRYTLNNNQVWQLTGSEMGTRPEVGDTVRIKAGLFGSYMLFKKDSKRSFRAKRIDQ